MSDIYKFGYPSNCVKCVSLGDTPKRLNEIKPFYKEGNEIKIMLIGQDPTIFKDPERVNTVLMLEDVPGRKSQLRKWLQEELIGTNIFEEVEIYATNLVKCQFSKPPSQSGGKKFLNLRYENCRSFLIDEIEKYKPTLVLTFGEPAHLLFSKELDVISGQLKSEMKNDFNGNFIRAKINNTEFDYSPCLHIKTFRIAETYGDTVRGFKSKLAERLTHK
ncbi:MAG: Uracil glycosylase superfamily [Bacteroidota bacterium]|jgi:uracil-DNA glycosylase